MCTVCENTAACLSFEKGAPYAGTEARYFHTLCANQILLLLWTESNGCDRNSNHLFAVFLNTCTCFMLKSQELTKD